MRDDDEAPSAWDQAVAAHEVSLRKGQRVRIMPGEGCHHHGEQEAGVTGIIIRVYPSSRDHRYTVLFDRPLWITRTHIAVWCYAASELTPIPWPTPEEVVADTLRRLDALRDD